MAKTYTDSNGYRRFSDSGTLVHRWVAEKRIGRSLNSWEPVHHINRDKRDNSMNNVWAFVGKSGWKRHNRAHEEDLEDFGLW